MQRRMCRTAVDRQRRITVLTYPRAVRTRRSRGAMPVSRTLLPKIGLGPRKARVVFAAGSDVCGMRSREALHRSVSAARNSRTSISLLSHLQH